MRIRPLFEKYQPYLLSFANTKFGRNFLGIADKDPIVKITPDSFHILKDPKTIQATFYSGSPFLKTFGEVLTKIDIAGEAYGLPKQNRELVIPHHLGFTYCPTMPLVMLSSLTAYPDAHPETTTVDGFIKSQTTTWALAHNATEGTVVNSSDTGSADDAVNVFQSGASDFQVIRSAFLFDTSSITDTDVIMSAIFSVYIVSKSGSNTINVYASTPASNTDLVLGDFDQFGTTAYATAIGIGDMTNGAYCDWTLNATGRNNISKTGVTKLGLRDVECDVADSTPGARHSIEIKMADNGTNKPKLVVTYLNPGGFFFTDMI